MQREEVYKLIDGERDYQDTLDHTRTDGCAKGVGDYLTLIQHYHAEAVKAWTKNPGNAAGLDVVRKIAGIAVHCMEEHGAPPRLTKAELEEIAIAFAKGYKK
jgi:hypothetical protein